MIYNLTKLNVTDNSGPIIVECIKILSRGRYANIGNQILTTVQKKNNNFRGGVIVRAIIVRTKKGIIRPNGTKIKFDNNSVILYSNKTENLLGTKIFGVVTRELRKWHFLKILSLAESII